MTSQQHTNGDYQVISRANAGAIDWANVATCVGCAVFAAAFWMAVVMCLLKLAS